MPRAFWDIIDVGKVMESVEGLEAGGSVGTCTVSYPEGQMLNPVGIHLYLPSTWNNAVAEEGTVIWRRRQSSVVTEDVQEPVKASF